MFLTVTYLDLFGPSLTDALNLIAGCWILNSACFSMSFSESDQKEVVLSEDDMSVQFVEGHEVDLKGVIRDHLVISLPMKSLLP